MSKSMLIIDTPKSCSECSQCDGTYISSAEGCFIECFAFNEVKELRLESVKKYAEQRHPQCPLQDKAILIKKVTSDIVNMIYENIEMAVSFPVSIDCKLPVKLAREEIEILLRKALVGNEDE